jgi:hypothetical protein
VDRHSFLHGAVHVVLDRAFLEVFGDGEGAAWDGEDRGVAEEHGEFLGVHGGGGDDQFYVAAFLGDFAQNAEEDVGVEAALMGLVHDDGAVHL